MNTVRYGDILLTLIVKAKSECENVTAQGGEGDGRRGNRREEEI